MSQNKRRSARPRAAAKRPTTNKGRRKKIEDEQKILHAQIGALEGFIAGSPLRETRAKARSKGVIPPPEGRRGANAKRSGRKCYAQQHRQNTQRDQHVIVFFLLFVAACWLAWWLLNNAGY